MPEMKVLYLYYGFKLVVEKIKIEDFHQYNGAPLYSHKPVIYFFS